MKVNPNYLHVGARYYYNNSLTSFTPPQTRTAMAQTLGAIALPPLVPLGPIWNVLPLSTLSKILLSFHAFFSFLETYFFHHGLIVLYL